MSSYRAITAATLLAAGTLMGATHDAAAIPAAQKACRGDVQVLTVAQGQLVMPGMQVTVSGGSAGRSAIVQFTANMNVDPAAEIRLAYSVDGGAAVENLWGPANIANHQEFWETRSTFAVVPIPAGVHTVRAWWRISGAVGKNGIVHTRCITAESLTS